MMKKQTKLFVASLAVVFVLGGLCAALLLAPPAEEAAPEVKEILLADHAFMDVTRILIRNGHGEYEVLQKEGRFQVADIPGNLVNGEYLELLIDAAGRIRAEEKVVDSAVDLSIYGLAEPEATVLVEYKDGAFVKLSLGSDDSLAQSVYMQLQGDPSVYLMKHAYSRRFTLPLENYIDYLITPGRVGETFAVMRDITFSGSALPEPVVIEYLDLSDPADQRRMLSFGAASHLIVSPGLHEIDQKKAAEVFNSLTGLISEEIVDYNCTAEELSAYGFDDPYMEADFVMENADGKGPQHFNVEVVKRADGSFIATEGGRGVVYRILNVAFLSATYENMTSRWFLTPFNTDLSSLSVKTPQETLRFTLSGNTGTDLTAHLNGKGLDIEIFRAYYRLLMSAINDGGLRANEKPQGAPAAIIEYEYKDPEKPEDRMELYLYGDRQLLVKVNDLAEFTMKRSFLERLLEANETVVQGGIINENW